MKIHEYQAAQIFKAAGLPVVEGEVATRPTEAIEIAKKTGYPVVLKAQVLVGGRGKAGGIKVVSNPEELSEKFKELQSLSIKGYLVEKILVVKAVKIVQEFYCAVAIDSIAGDIVLIASAAGGVDIEETAKTNPEAIKKYYLQGKKEIDEARFSGFVAEIFKDDKNRQKAAHIFKKLIEVFIAQDCSIAEINPLVLDDNGEMFALDAKINFDDNASFRHAGHEALRDKAYEDADELEAKESNLSFVKLDGNVGCIVNGAGLAMGTMDIVKLMGGDPANFLDVGGSSNPQKVLKAFNIILRNKSIKAILINIFGGITRCDDIANGILEAKRQIDLPVPLVVRLTGTNEKEAKKLLADNGITTYSTMREAVERVVGLSK